MKDNILYLVIPCYNEEEVLPETIKQLKKKMSLLIKKEKISPKSKVLFVNDGSKDETWEIIKNIHENDSLFGGITLSRNRGHQNALLAGLMEAKKYADMIISMDADLQDDINVIDKMVFEYDLGNEIVYGVRSSRKKDSLFKRMTARAFYKIMLKFGVDIIYDHADCRLMSKRALNELEKFDEVNLFLRGIVPLIGFKTTIVTYDRNERFAGKSKYSLKKMLSFAIDGITSFSIKPLRMIFNMGIIFLVISLGLGIWFLIRHCNSSVVTPMNMLYLILCFLSGINLISLGIVGEYIGKMYIEVKHRPKYIIEEELISDEKI